MRGRTHEYHSSLRIIQVVTASRDRATYVVLIPKILICEIVLGTDEYAAWTIVATRHRYKEVSVFFQWLTVLPYHVVQTEIKLV